MSGAFALVGRLAFLQRLFTVGAGHLGRTNNADLWRYKQHIVVHVKPEPEAEL